MTNSAFGHPVLFQPLVFRSEATESHLQATAVHQHGIISARRSSWGSDISSGLTSKQVVLASTARDDMLAACAKVRAGTNQLAEGGLTGIEALFWRLCWQRTHSLRSRLSEGPGQEAQKQNTWVVSIDRHSAAFGASTAETGLERLCRAYQRPEEPRARRTPSGSATCRQARGY